MPGTKVGLTLPGLPRAREGEGRRVCIRIVFMLIKAVFVPTLQLAPAAARRHYACQRWESRITGASGSTTAGWGATLPFIALTADFATTAAVSEAVTTSTTPAGLGPFAVSTMQPARCSPVRGSCSSCDIASAASDASPRGAQGLAYFFGATTSSSNEPGIIGGRCRG